MPYLHDLGVSDVYLSPVGRARLGSQHGYDGVDPRVLNPELGNETVLEGLAVALRRHRMGCLLDIVPNHVAVGFENPWWRSILAHGPASRYAPYFDVDWFAEPTLVERVLVPILGRPFGEALEAAELALAVDEGRLVVRYYEHRFPLDPGTWRPVLDQPTAQAGLPEVRERLDSLLEAVDSVPPRHQRSRAALQRRQRIARELKRGLAAAVQVPSFSQHLEACFAALQGTPGEPRSFDRLEAVLLQQPWRLVFWRSGYERLNYRRFFNINELVGLRVEDARVFESVHQLPLRLLRNGWINGLRIDHIDGLYDPQGYLERLQQRFRDLTGDDGYVVVEKILTGHERLPEEWSVSGSTGYDFLASLNGVFVDPGGLRVLDEVYERESGAPTDWEDLVYHQKRRVIGRFFMPEIHALERHLRQLAAMDRHGRDVSPMALQTAIVEVTAGLPVYRTYVRDFEVSERDLDAIDRAVAEAERHGRAEARALGFLRRVLRLDLTPGLSEGERATWLRFLLRWQQLTGPAMAKGVEDTAFYIYNRLVALNEVGGEPVGPRDPVGDFHAFCDERARTWPATMNATSTHDTKRSEDVRARIAVLSEVAEVWSDRLPRWSRIAAERAGVEPDLWLRSLVFQSMIGAWPLHDEEVPAFRERFEAYLVKASREAKVETSWLDPNAQAEEELVRFALAFLDDPPDDFHQLREKVALHGACNALAQTLLRCTAPGVPDLYQGNELWDFSLVDPDNRRPVDWGLRARLLASLEQGPDPRELLDQWRDGRAKLLVTSRALRLRRRRPEVFRDGGYEPVPVTGACAGNVIAFRRFHEQGQVLVVAPRLTTQLAQRFPLGDCWQDTRVAIDGEWSDVLWGDRRGGESLALADLLAHFPVALLER